MSDDPRTQYLDRCRALIDQHGHMVQSVFPDATTPGFTYTIGLQARGLPELLTIGLPANTAQSLLNALAQRLVDGDIPDGQDIRELANLPMRLRTHRGVPVGLLNVIRALDPEAPERLTVRQLVWPDPQGRFPEDPGYAMPIRQALSELPVDDLPH